MSQSVSPWIAFSLLLSASATSMASTISIDTPTSAASYGSYYDAPTVGSTAVFAVGVYEHMVNREFQQHPTGPIQVHVEQQNQPSILVLSSYESVEWQLDGAGLSNVSQVYLFGYHDQSVTGLPLGATVTEFSNLGTRNYQGFSYTWAGEGATCQSNVPWQQHESNYQTCRALAFQSTVQSLTGSPITAFAGTYKASEFTIGTYSPAAAVPEPESLVLAALGLGVVLTRRRAKALAPQR